MTPKSKVFRFPSGPEAIKVGDTVVLQMYYDQSLHEVPVTRIGRVYITVGKGWREHQFSLETGRHKSAHHSAPKIYPSIEKRKEFLEQQDFIESVRERLKEALQMGHITFEPAREISYVMDWPVPKKFQYPSKSKNDSRRSKPTRQE